MKSKRCALVAASVLAVCTVAFLCRQRSSVEAEGHGFVSSSAQQAQAVAPAGSAAVSEAVAPSSNQTATVRGTKPYVLTCAQGFNKPMRLAAESLGMRTVSVLSRKSLLVEADAAAVARVAADGRFAVEMEFLPSEKIAPALAAAIAEGAETVDVTFLTLSEEDRKIVQGRIAARGGKILGGCLNTEDTFSARLPAGLVAELASCGDVRWMEQFVRPHLMNDVAVNAEAMNVRAVWKSDDRLDGLSGEGQIISTSDSGIDTGDLTTLHEDLRDRILDMKASKTDTDEDCDMFDGNGHGTHTAGSIVGNGSNSVDRAEGLIRGTAWGAQLCVWFCGKGGTESVYSPKDCAELFRGDAEGAAWDAYIHSASWGSDTGGRYTVDCEKFDSYLWNHPDFLPVVSAGNAGSSQRTVGSPAAAKNVLAVGATQNLSKGDPSRTAAFSSRGPCADGRIKPDIAAPGDAVLSTRSSKVKDDKTPYEPYTSMSGTSMSCPLTAGAVALVREWLMRNPAAWKVEGKPEVPTAALMKAIVTGGAKDAAVPNNDQGWGRVDLADTLFPANNRAVKLIDRIPLADGDELAWIVETTAAAPLDVQLAWVDYPGSSSGSQGTSRLINDIDLTVCPLDTKVLYYGNGGDSPDVLNNLESVRLPEAAKGQYLVTVSGKSLPYDYTGDSGAVALYIRGAFEPDEVVERYTVRIVKSPATTNNYVRLDKALNAAKDGDVIEILDETELRESVILTNDYALTITATNANPFASRIGRRNSADILVKNGSLFFSNTVFAAEEITPVKTAESGIVKVAGTAVFDDIVSRTPGILTDRPQGFELAGKLLNGITIECTKASQANDPFGVYSCSYEVASDCAPRLVSTVGTDRAGEATKDGFLVWRDDAPVDPAAAVAYVNGDEPVYYRTLERLFGEHTNGANVVITKSGVRLEKPRTLTGKRSISAAEGLDTVVIHADGAAGFLIGAGCELTVSGITFEGYKGNGLFVVNGEGAKLTVTDSVFTDIEGTNKWSGAIVIQKGSASVSDSVFDNCRATGEYRQNKAAANSFGGAIYIKGKDCSLKLNGGTITRCYANNYGGGIYAAGDSTVSVRGALTVKGNWSGNNTDADNIHLATLDATLTLAGKLEGEDAVGVRYFQPGNGKGNEIGDNFIAVKKGVAHKDAVDSLKAFFNDAHPEETRADVDANPARNLLWCRRDRGDRSVSPKDSDATIRVTMAKEGSPKYYVRPEYAFEDWIDADATVEVLKDAAFGADLVVTNGITVKLMSANDSPSTLSRSGSFRIRVLPGATLVTANIVLDGNGDEASVGLITVENAALELRAGTVVENVSGSANRASGAISIQNHGTFTMRSGAKIVNCVNSFVNMGSKSSYGGGLLVEDGSTANLFGGSITGCGANCGGGAFIGTKSTVKVGGDLIITDNRSGGQTDNLCVADQSQLVLVAPLTGSVGYNEGHSGNTNVFGRIAADFSGDKQASAHNFTHDVTGDVGMAVSDGSETLLVWGSALDAAGKYDGTYALVNGGEPLYEIPVPNPANTNYDGTAKTCLTDGVGYRVLYGNVATNIGNYTVAVTTRAGFAWEDGTTGRKKLPWKIEAAEYELKGVTFEDATFEYDGTMKYLALTGTLPDGFSVEYENNGRWQPGTNEVRAVISGSAPNYKPNPFKTTLQAKLIIVDPEGKYNGETEPPGPVPPPGPQWEVVTNHPTPIAFKSIIRESDTEWRLVITDRVEYCNYRLLWTTNLVEGFVSTGAWEHAVGDAAFPEWTTNVITTGGAWFWRAEGADGTNMVLKVEE